MNNNTELRARARANLGNSLFHSNWLMGVAVCVVGSMVANFFPLLLAGNQVGLASLYSTCQTLGC